MRFLKRDELRRWFDHKSVAIVGSGPGCLENRPGFVDSHDTVVRVNNYKTGDKQGYRCDVFYSFFGQSIRKDKADLQKNGVQLCMCKCPNAKAIESRWHETRRKMRGVDYRWIYEGRENWWFCDTYIPTTSEFLEIFEVLDRHVPTTGFAALWEISQRFRPKSIYLTGFDFFTSGIHNVNERWRMNNPNDPIGHVPDKELAWVQAHAPEFEMDDRLRSMMVSI